LFSDKISTFFQKERGLFILKSKYADLKRYIGEKTRLKINEFKVKSFFKVKGCADL
jgi:hypothetical protein